MKKTIEKSDWVVLRLMRVIAEPEGHRTKDEEFYKTMNYLVKKYQWPVLLAAIAQLRKERS